MKEIWGLIVCLFIYTMTFLWFGMWIQTKLDSRQIVPMTEAAWKDGCDQCEKYTRNECDRDQIQGEPEHPEATQ